MQQALISIKKELRQRLDQLVDDGKLLEAQRLEQRTNFDLEMLEATGVCNGIENYSRYLTGRAPGEPPPHCLNSFPIMRLFLPMKAMSAFPKLAACIAATIVVNSHWRNMASACPRVWTTVRLNSKNGTPCAPNPSMFPQRQELGIGTKRRCFHRTGYSPNGPFDRG